MPEDELKKIENEIEKTENKIGSEVEAENARLRRELEELKKEQAIAKDLRKEATKSAQAGHDRKDKITEVEIQINLDSAAKFSKTLYNIFIQKKVLFYALLIIAIIIGIMIRTSSLSALGASPLIGNNYLDMGGSLTGLDPYTFYIQTLNILKSGNVPVNNYLEYPPLGKASRSDDQLISFFDAYQTRLMQPFVPGAVPMTWVMLYPVIVSVFATILLFLICISVFDDTSDVTKYSMAALSAFIFPVFQTLLNRTTAGFSTKDAMGFLFILLAVYFLIKAIKSKNTRSKIVYGFMVMLATTLTADTSGFSKFIFFLVPIVYIIMILFNYAKKGDLYAFLPFGLFFPLWATFYSSLNTEVLISSIQYYPIYLCYVMVVFKLLVYDKYHQKLKIPFVNAGMSIAIYSIVIITLLLTAIGKIGHVLNYLVQSILYPIGIGVVNPVSQTIAEYGQVTLANRICDAGGMIGSCGDPNAIGINFILLSAAGVFLLYYFLRRFKHWYLPFLIALPFLIFLGGALFTPGAGAYSFLLVFVLGAFIPLGWWAKHRKEPEMKRALSPIVFMTIVSIILSLSFFLASQSTNYYKYGLFGIAITIAIAFLFDKIEDKGENKAVYIVLLVFLLLAVLFANLENQLLEGIGFIGVLVVPFAIVVMVTAAVRYFRGIFKNNKRTALLISVVIIVLAVLFVALDLNISLQASYNASSQSGSGLALWGPTMLWINQNTPVNSSIISWWDYGYWEEAIGNRTAVADGSNGYGYQTMIAKYLFTATSPYQYATLLTFLHKPAYFVISGSEVEKFSAITTISQNYTQYTPMVETQEAYNQGTVPGGYKYLAVFGGNNGGIAPLEANTVISGVPWNASTTLLIQVIVPFNSTNTSFSVGPIYGQLYNELTQQTSGILLMQYNCVYGSGCFEQANSTTVIPGGVMMLNASNTATLKIGGYPTYPGGYQPAQISMSSYGNSLAVLFMPQKSLNNLFTKLYLLNETVPGFSLVFSDGLPVNSLLSINNQVLTNINVYKINYTVLAGYNLTGECSADTSAPNYCADAGKTSTSFLPSLFNQSQNRNLVVSTPIP